MTTPLNPGSADVKGILNGYAPKQGAKGLPVSLNFAAETEYVVDFYEAETSNAISFIQSVYADNTDNDDELVFVFDITGQRIVVPANAQGIWPVIASQKSKCTITTTAAAGLVCKAIFLNVPMPLTMWGPNTVNVGNINVAFAPTQGNWVDRSTATNAAASKQLMAANATRQRMVVQNPSGNAESIWINFGAAAVRDNTSIEIAPGGIFDSGFSVSTQAVNVIATGAIPVAAKEQG